MKNSPTTDLQDAFKTISKAENRFRFNFLLITIIICVLCGCLLVFTYYKVKKSTTELNTLKSQKTILNDSVKSLSNVLKSLGAFSEYSMKWDSTDIEIQDYNKFQLAKDANKNLIEFARNNRLDAVTYIRYYLKRKDQYPNYHRRKEDKRNRVQNSLRKIGYRFIDIRTDSYKSPIGSNIIHYHPDVSKKDLKAIALALLRAGIELKEIVPYSENTVKFKPNSIEIGTNEKITNQPTLTAKEILEMEFK